MASDEAWKMNACVCAALTGTYGHRSCHVSTLTCWAVIAMDTAEFTQGLMWNLLFDTGYCIRCRLTFWTGRTATDMSQMRTTSAIPAWRNRWFQKLLRKLGTVLVPVGAICDNLQIATFLSSHLLDCVSKSHLSFFVLQF